MPYTLDVALRPPSGDEENEKMVKIFIEVGANP
jgi:hypothetical protein